MGRHRHWRVVLGHPRSWWVLEVGHCQRWWEVVGSVHCSWGGVRHVGAGVGPSSPLVGGGGGLCSPLVWGRGGPCSSFVGAR